MRYALVLLITMLGCSVPPPAPSAPAPARRHHPELVEASPATSSSSKTPELVE